MTVSEMLARITHDINNPMAARHGILAACSGANLIPSCVVILRESWDRPGHARASSRICDHFQARVSQRKGRLRRRGFYSGSWSSEHAPPGPTTSM